MAYPSSFAHHRQTFAATVLIALPWLNPFSPGPMPAAVPMMVSWSCIAILLVWTSFWQPQLDSKSSTAAIANAWLLAAMLSAGMGMIQYFGVAHVFGPWVSNLAAGEAYANLRQRNQFATLCSLGLLSLLWRVATWRSHQMSIDKTPRGPSATHWLSWGLGALLLAGGNAASGSRTGFLQWWLIAGMGLLWWLRGRAAGSLSNSPRRSAAMALAAVVMYLACLWFLPRLLWLTTGVESGGLLARFGEESGCGSRSILWANVLHLIALKPWMGWGWGELGFAHFVTLYPGVRFCDILDNGHNLPLHLAVELGLPIAVGVCGGLAWLVIRARPWCESHPVRQLAFGVLAVIALHSLVEYPLWYGPFQMAAGLSVWLLWFTPALADTGPDGLVQTPTAFVISPLAVINTAFIALFLGAGTACAAWSYWRVSQLYLPQAERAPAYQENALGKLQAVRLFKRQVQFAELTTTPLTADNAAHLNVLALELLHFSPEPRVAEKVIESAAMLQRDDVTAFFSQRYQAAFPKEHAHWAAQLTGAGHKTP